MLENSSSSTGPSLMRPLRHARPETINLLLAGYFLAVLNFGFWSKLFSMVAPSSAYEWLFLGAMMIIAGCLLVMFFGLFNLPRIYKPFATFWLIACAASSYFFAEYGTVIDADMLRNILRTDNAEVRDLITLKLVLYIGFLGVVPAVLLWSVSIRYRSFWKEVKARAAATAAMLLVMAGLSIVFSQDILSVFREHRMLLAALNPFNSVRAITVLGLHSVRTHVASTVTFGEDAHRGSGWTHRSPRSVTVLVIGETARAANFSLNGYRRETNPRLAQVEGLINFTNVTSCGTATAQSLPCMFSGVGRSGQKIGVKRDGLLQLLKRSGFSLLWRENQGGCVGVCEGVPTEILTRTGKRVFFDFGESRDENLVQDLRERIQAMSGNVVVVLHMMGSHGPAYFRRYPPEYEVFKPACKESQFSRCTNSEIVNSYDNTIVYTDAVLASLIDELKAEDAAGVPAMMIYLSDHGESLGESNIFLHGMPYAFAPSYQTHVPMLAWLSPLMRTDLGIDMACMQRHRTEAVSHDNFFHSVIGALDVSTKVYARGLDVFARCRSATPRD